MQQEMFIDSLADAMSELVTQLGGPKKVGLMLWPEKTMRGASTYLNDCLNPDCNSKLSLEQIDFLLSEARKKNIHVVAKYFGDTYSYRVEPVEPEDRKNDLYHQFIQGVDKLNSIQQELKKLNGG